MQADWNDQPLEQPTWGSHKGSARIVRALRRIFGIDRLTHAIEEQTHAIHQLRRDIMSELNDAVTRITASVQNEIDAVVAKLQQANPDVAAAITQLNSLSDKLDAETGSLGATGATGATGA